MGRRREVTCAAREQSVTARERRALHSGFMQPRAVGLKEENPRSGALPSVTVASSALRSWASDRRWACTGRCAEGELPLAPPEPFSQARPNEAPASAPQPVRGSILLACA